MKKSQPLRVRGRVNYQVILRGRVNYESYLEGSRELPK